jgi:hypothetical protein
MFNQLFHKQILLVTQYDQIDHGLVLPFNGPYHVNPTNCGLRLVGIHGNYVYQWAHDVYTAHGDSLSGLYEKERRKIFMVLTHCSPLKGTDVLEEYISSGTSMK